MTLSKVSFEAGRINALTQSIENTPDPLAPVTGILMDNGEYHVLSRFGDPNWQLPPRLFPLTVPKNKQVLWLERVPKAFQEVYRSCVLHYCLYGREGYGQVAGATLVKTSRDMVAFLKYLEDKNIDCLSSVRQMHYIQYAEHCKTLPGRVPGTTLANKSIAARLAAIELLHELSKNTKTPMAKPWPDSSISLLIGGQITPSNYVALTKIIPDDILATLFTKALKDIEKADHLAKALEDVCELEATGASYNQICARLKQHHITKHELNTQIRIARDACMVIIMLTSGIRAHELGSLKAGCAYKTEGENGQTYYWIKGRSDKTKAGDCEWLVGETTHKAVKALEILLAPIREELSRRFREAMLSDGDAHTVLEYEMHRNALLIGVQRASSNVITTMSGDAIGVRVKAYAKDAGVDWSLTPHQFRRTFAVYAAHSALGDLRYLRDHFKHWSLDMTTLYAMNRQQEVDLYDEISSAALDAKLNLLTHWLEEDALITGGGSNPIKQFRSSNEEVVTYESRKELATKLSPLINIRATGVAWCTADTSGCSGGQGIEKTRCGDCANAVIDMGKKRVWEGIYAHQLELLSLNDIGPSGKARIEKDIRRCEQVLVELGANRENLINAAS